MDESRREDLKDISLLMALGAVQRAGTVSSLLYQAWDICMRADDPAYRPLGEDILKMIDRVPGASARLARALGVEPEGLDFYSENDHLRDLVEFRKERGLPVVEDEEGFPEVPPFEHHADLYRLLCNPAHTKEGEEPNEGSEEM